MSLITVNPKVKLEGHNFDPTELFVLSRITSSMTIKDLISITPFPYPKTAGILKRLLELNLIALGSADNSVKAPSEEMIPFAIYEGDPVDLNEAVEIDLDKKKKILYLYQYLKRLDYYTLLEVTAQAPRIEIKKAYFRLSKEYHPDQYFRKNLGRYKEKIEEIYKQINQAYEILSNEETRIRYDTHRAILADAEAINCLFIELSRAGQQCLNKNKEKK